MRRNVVTRVAVRVASKLAAVVVALGGGTPLWGDEPSVGDMISAAGRAAAAGKHEQALDLYSQALKARPEQADLYQLRGVEHFKAGRVHDSVLDYRKYCELVPTAAVSHWQLGISLYYDGQFAAGQKQFEAYQTFDDNDVENAVWKFLCQVPREGLESARKSMLKIKRDRRVPMMEIYDLYRGQIEPADVLKAVRADDPAPGVLSQRLFYAHLYLGLYYEVLKQPDPAREHITLAAEKYRISHYMGDVAVVHAARLKKP